MELTRSEYFCFAAKLLDEVREGAESRLLLESIKAYEQFYSDSVVWTNERVFSNIFRHRNINLMKM